MSLLVIALIVLALLAGGIGLLVEGLKWLLIIAVVLILAGVISAALRGGKRSV